MPPVPERKVSLPVQLPPMAKAQQELIQELKQEVGVQLYSSCDGQQVRRAMNNPITV